MVTKCIINTCNTIKAGDGVSLHRLPSNAQVQQEWFRAILHETGQTVFSEDDVICSKHFSSDCFVTVDGKVVLNPTAVPFESLKVDGPEPKRVKRDKDSKPRCCVFSCENSMATTENVRPQLAYHRFPKDPEIIEQWKQFCNNDVSSSESSYVCSDHFNEDDYVSKRGVGRTKTLKSDAVPTIYKRENTLDEQEEVGTLSSITLDSPKMSSGDGCTPVTVSVGSVDLGTDETLALHNNGKTCIVQTCQSRTQVIPDIEFFQIPNHLNARRTWIKLIQTSTKQIDIPNNAILCSLHFTSDCFKPDAENSKKTLLPHAVPSVFPKPKIENDEFPVMSSDDFGDPERGRKFYEWSLKNYQEQKKTILFLKEQASLQSKRIARLAKSIDDFKAKKFVSEEANNALQSLFDKIIDAQYEVI